MFEAKVAGFNDVYILRHVTIFSLLVKKFGQQMTCYDLNIMSCSRKIFYTLWKSILPCKLHVNYKLHWSIHPKFKFAQQLFSANPSYSPSTFNAVVSAEW